jgi:hypothetical protein
MYQETIATNFIPGGALFRYAIYKWLVNGQPPAQDQLRTPAAWLMVPHDCLRFGGEAMLGDALLFK